jgi:predicted phage tail protein
MVLFQMRPSNRSPGSAAKNAKTTHVQRSAPSNARVHINNLVISSKRIGYLASGLRAAVPALSPATDAALAIFLAAGGFSYTRRLLQRRRS